MWTTGQLWITSLDHEAAAVVELEADDPEPDPDFDPVDPDFAGLVSAVDLPLAPGSDFLSPPDSDLPLAPPDSDLPFELDCPSCEGPPERLSVR